MNVPLIHVGNDKFMLTTVNFKIVLWTNFMNFFVDSNQVQGEIGWYDSQNSIWSSLEYRIILSSLRWAAFFCREIFRRRNTGICDSFV